MRIFFTFLLLLSGALSAPLFAQSWQWGRGCTGPGMEGWPVATDPSGNVFVAGINSDSGQLVSFGAVVVPDAGLGSYQCIIAKYDANGNLLWVHGTQNGNTNLIGMTTDQSGNAFLFGSFRSATMQIGAVTLTNPLPPLTQYFLAKYDPAGNVVWAVTAGSSQWNYLALGATGGYPGFAEVLGLGGVATDMFGNVYITANFQRSSITIGSTTLVNADPTGSTNDILLVKYDPSGNVAWAKSTGGNGNDEAYGITVTPAGNIYIAGVFGSSSWTFGPSVITNASGEQVAFIAECDGAGNPVWACGSGGSGGEYALGLASDVSGNVYLTGGLKDKSITFNGTTIANPDAGKPVLYLVKFDPEHNVSWYKTIAAVADTDYGVWGYSIAITQCGIVWVSGCMHSAVNIDGHILSPPAMSSDPVFIAGYTSSGTYAGSTALQSGGDDQNGIACDAWGNVFMCADYETYPFSIASDTFPSPPFYSELLFVGKYASQYSPMINATTTKTNYCLTGSITLDAHTGYANYTWNDGNKAATRTVTDTGTFWVCGSDSCTNATVDTFKITASCDCNRSVFVPNAFTPNGDGQDDVFYPRCGWNVKKIKTFRVYNRWGELLFEREDIDPNDASNAWDGTYKGNLPLPDVYVWIVDAVCENGNLVNKKGSVTVIR